MLALLVPGVGMGAGGEAPVVTAGEDIPTMATMVTLPTKGKNR